jgi:hypothetical protein
MSPGQKMLLDSAINDLVIGCRLQAWNIQRHEWSQETFGESSQRGPTGPLKHLEKEAKEAYEEKDRGKRLEEYADCLHLIFDAVDRDGYSLSDLMTAAEQKLEKNRLRNWQKPTTDEPVEHVRDDSTSIN